MKDLGEEEMQSLISGSTFYGTGGGGHPRDGTALFDELIKTGIVPRIAQLSDFSDEALFITAFTIGSLVGNLHHTAPLIGAYRELSRYLNSEIAGIIPVEIGPKSVATTIYLASILGLPVLDADIVGGRSTPEVYLETITLNQIVRTPLVVSSGEGESVIITSTLSSVREEELLRSTALAMGGLAYVVGYPLSKLQVAQSIELGTITRTLEVGNAILKRDFQTVLGRTEAQMMASGTICEIGLVDSGGFLQGEVTILSDDGNTKLFIKNENLILWKNNEPQLTCPDLIILLDSELTPTYNTDLLVGMKVNVLGVPATDKWRTQAGCKLFHPEQFVAGVKQVLL